MISEDDDVGAQSRHLGCPGQDCGLDVVVTVAVAETPLCRIGSGISEAVVGIVSLPKEAQGDSRRGRPVPYAYSGYHRVDDRWDAIVGDVRDLAPVMCCDAPVYEPPIDADG